MSKTSGCWNGNFWTKRDYNGNQGGTYTQYSDPSGVHWTLSSSGIIRQPVFHLLFDCTLGQVPRHASDAGPFPTAVSSFRRFDQFVKIITNWSTEVVFHGERSSWVF
jgi:hypothetical protein